MQNVALKIQAAHLHECFYKTIPLFRSNTLMNKVNKVSGVLELPSGY